MSTVVKLIALADQIVEEWGKEAFLLSETEYMNLLSEIHKRICLDGKWSGEKSWRNNDMADDQLLMMLLGIIFILYNFLNHHRLCYR